MQYLMIHDIRREYFDLDLDRYRLTFDDGLFSQYYYYPLYKNPSERLTFFISTSFIQPGNGRRMYEGEDISYLKPKKYMYRSFIENKFDHFMRIEEIQALATKSNVRIGVHSHFHDVIMTTTHPRKPKPLSPWKLARFNNRLEIVARNLNIRSRLAYRGYCVKDDLLIRRTEAQWDDYIKYDTELCLKWMEDNLGLRPELYCFPFNEHNERLIAILKTYGFRKFFAARPGKSTDVIGRTDIDKLMRANS